jgi:hypothetical protein
MSTIEQVVVVLIMAGPILWRRFRRWWNCDDVGKWWSQ